VADVGRLLETIRDLEEQLKRTPRDVGEAYAQGIEAPAEHIAKLEAQRDALKEALHRAWTDISHWVKLATYQREMMDQNLGWCPTAAGISGSRVVLEQIAEALRLSRVAPVEEGK
jgi:hypothetical protein